MTELTRAIIEEQGWNKESLCSIFDKFVSSDRKLSKRFEVFVKRVQSEENRSFMSAFELD